MPGSSKNQKYENINEFLRMSLVPVPCQECKLDAKGNTNSESIEWLWDLKDKMPIWSRLNEINTSGYKRKLPMSMAKNYDIEINGRLWSLWGHELNHKQPLQSHSKSYMAITVMALCAARVISFNKWNTILMDTIRENGKKFYRQSLKESNCCHKKFKLENLGSDCNLDGIDFKINLKTVQQGYLYSTPFKCLPNLAYALIQFLGCYQYGVLECCKRILGFGYIDGPSGGYFMYDAQSSGYPLFSKNVSAPYVLRTTHLQVLLYCLVVSLNVTEMHVCFCLHRVQIHLVEANRTKNIQNNSSSSCTSVFMEKPIKINSVLSLKSASSEINLEEELNKITKLVNESIMSHIEKEKKAKYRSIDPNIMPYLQDNDHKSDDNDNNYQIDKDFVEKISSYTTINMTSDNCAATQRDEFYYKFLDALAKGSKDSCKVPLFTTL